MQRQQRTASWVLHMLLRLLLLALLVLLVLRRQWWQCLASWASADHPLHCDTVIKVEMHWAVLKLC
jgi:hypothetical protein